MDEYPGEARIRPVIVVRGGARCREIGEGSSDSARPEHDAANRVARLRRTSTSEHRRGSAARIADNSIDPELVLSIVQAVSDSIYARLLATMSATAEE